MGPEVGKTYNKLIKRSTNKLECTALSFSPDDLRVMAASTNGIVLVWDLATEQEQPPITLDAGTDQSG